MTTRLGAVLALVTLAACGGKALPPGSQPPAVPPPGAAGRATSSAEPVLAGAGAHLLLLVEVDQSGGRVLEARRVAVALPRTPAPTRPGWRAEVVDGAGTVLHAAELAAPDGIHGEFPAPDGSLERVELRPERAVVLLRLPLLPAAASVRLSAAPAALPAGDARRQRAAVGGAVLLATVPYPQVAP